ncbi:MAG: ABC transporter substrate-binding protein [Bacillota bacterium]|nr:ABC transporter substrate-binding protein [Bacillota bacterium]
MKKAVRLLVVWLLCLSMAGCSSSELVNEPTTSPSLEPAPHYTAEETEERRTNEDGEESAAEDEKVITVYCDTGEVFDLIKKFQELHPDFEYEIEIYTEYAFGDEYPDRVHDLVNGRLDVIPDIYSVAREDIYKFTKGSDHEYALPFEELGIDVDKLIEEAEIPQYMMDAYTNPQGKLVALAYQNTAGAFIYRRSIAKKVWGTDDPDVISSKIGPRWDKFMKAAAELKAKGYGICSGAGDIWKPIEMSSEQGWFKDGQLVIDPAREAFLDYAREMVENGYTNNNNEAWWTDEWLADIRGEGEKEVFGFFGPYWFANFSMVYYCGGDSPGEGTYGDWAVCDPPAGFFQAGTIILAHRNTRHKEAVGEVIRWLTLDTSETGCQYLLASGEIDGIRHFPASAAVAKKLDYKFDFLGGQDLFEAYLSAAQYARADSLSEHDRSISYYWRNEAIEYAEGRKTREQAITDFKEYVDQYLGYYAERDARKNNLKETQ